MYAITAERQEALLAHLKETGVDSTGWETRYLDPTTDEEWIGYFPYSEMQGGGPRYLRKKIVPEDWRSWIDVCLSSVEIDDAVGLATDVRSLKRDRLAVMTFLEKRWSAYPSRQRKAFIDRLSFPRDSRELLGKHISDIEKEWSEERDLLLRIEALKKHA